MPLAYLHARANTTTTATPPPSSAQREGRGYKRRAQSLQISLTFSLDRAQRIGVAFLFGRPLFFSGVPFTSVQSVGEVRRHITHARQDESANAHANGSEAREAG